MCLELGLSIFVELCYTSDLWRFLRTSPCLFVPQHAIVGLHYLEVELIIMGDDAYEI